VAAVVTNLVETYLDAVSALLLTADIVGYLWWFVEHTYRLWIIRDWRRNTSATLKPMLSAPEIPNKGLTKSDQLVDSRKPAQGAKYHFMESMRYFALVIKTPAESVLFGCLTGWLLIISGTVLLTA
jgi:hypothetical protein